MRTIIYGPPGTGKTHTLLQHIEKFLETTDPDKIGYFTFSKNAAIEGKERAAIKFRLSMLDDLPYFQTLHSFCFNQLGLSRDQVMKEKHYKELGEKMGIEIEGTQQDEDHDGVFRRRSSIDFKQLKSQELLGCNFETARKHIESLFKPGMSWDNYGKWHMDHIIPCASFDLRCPVQQLACCYYKNLQPLWAFDNMSKGSQIL